MRGRQAIRAGLTRDVVVEVHGGVYRITEPLAFGPDDSGTSDFAVVYMATPGDTVLLDGGRRIDGRTASSPRRCRRRGTGDGIHGSSSSMVARST